MSVPDTVRGPGAPTVDMATLADRIEALERFVKASDGRVEPARLQAITAVAEQVDARLQLSRDHTVVALAGATGSGKSSLFNALTGLELSRAGHLRPTTGEAHCCVWGPQGADELLTWLGIPRRRLFVRESALDGEDEAALRGLLLIDLPDFDSVAEAHRVEADRLTGLADLVVWVLDPEKYADAMLHDRYLRSLSRHRDATVVVLNQVDRLTADETADCLADIQRLVGTEGLAGVTVMATSARTGAGVRDLLALLVDAVAAREVVLTRIAGDVAVATAELGDLVGPDAAEDSVHRDAVGELAAVLADAAGVPAAVAGAGRVYREHAAAATSWLPARWLRRLRPDPLRQLDAEESADDDPIDFADLRDPGDAGRADLRGPEASAELSEAPAERSVVRRSQVKLAIRGLVTHAATGLPEPWAAAIARAANAGAGDLPDVLDRAIRGTDLGVDQRPWWWPVCNTAQWLALAATVLSVGWLVVALAVAGLPGAVTLAAVAVLVGAPALAALLALAVRPAVALGARRRQDAADRTLRAAVATVVRERIVGPVRGELREYANARAALIAAGWRSDTDS